jgi:hypothetical protein
LEVFQPGWPDEFVISCSKCSPILFLSKTIYNFCCRKK